MDTIANNHTCDVVFFGGECWNCNSRYGSVEQSYIQQDTHRSNKVYYGNVDCPVALLLLSQKEKDWIVGHSYPASYALIVA